MLLMFGFIQRNAYLHRVNHSPSLPSRLDHNFLKLFLTIYSSRTLGRTMYVLTVLETQSISQTQKAEKCTQVSWFSENVYQVNSLRCQVTFFQQLFITFKFSSISVLLLG